MYFLDQRFFKQIDVAFSFGGDGTIIHLARQIFSYNIPVCGINLGELGFLNQIEVHQLQSHIKRNCSKVTIQLKNEDIFMPI